MPERESLCTEAESNSALLSKNFIKQCDPGLIIYDKLAVVDKRDWKISEIKEFIKNYSVGSDPGSFYEQFGLYKESIFDNIKIPIYVMMTNNISTPYYNYYSIVQMPYQEPRLSQPKTIEQIAGDGEVPLVSQVGPGLKWADEFDNKLSGAKPVKFIHYCNALRQRAFGTYKNYYSDEDWMKTLLDQNNNAYLDLDCMCANKTMVTASEIFGDKITLSCGHMGGFQDVSVRNFIFQILKNGQRTDGLTDFVKKANEKYFSDLDEKCIFEKPSWLENWRKNYADKNEGPFNKSSRSSRRLRKRVLRVNKD